MTKLSEVSTNFKNVSYLFAYVLFKKCLKNLILAPWFTILWSNNSQNGLNTDIALNNLRLSAQKYASNIFDGKLLER